MELEIDDMDEQRTQRPSRMAATGGKKRVNILDRLDRPAQGRSATSPSILDRLDTPLNSIPQSRPPVEPKKAVAAASRTSDARNQKFNQNRGVSV